MINFIVRLFARIIAFRRVRLGDSGSIALASNVRLILEPGSELVVNNGSLKVGYNLPGSTISKSQIESVIHLESGSRLVCEGTVLIAPGASIRVAKDAVLRFSGRNLFGRNLMIICARAIKIGFGTSTSWNVTLIDDDGHTFFNSSGRPLRKIFRPLTIGDWVGLQSGVTVPSGIRIGNNSVVASGTTVRKDVPAECVVYQKSDLVVKSSICSRPPESFTPGA